MQFAVSRDSRLDGRCNAVLVKYELGGHVFRGFPRKTRPCILGILIVLGKAGIVLAVLHHPERVVSDADFTIHFKGSGMVQNRGIARLVDGRNRHIIRADLNSGSTVGGHTP